MTIDGERRPERAGDLRRPRTRPPARSSPAPGRLPRAARRGRGRRRRLRAVAGPSTRRVASPACTRSGRRSRRDAGETRCDPHQRAGQAARRRAAIEVFGRRRLAAATSPTSSCRARSSRTTTTPSPSVRRRPIGVVAAITPWNFPLILAVVEDRPGAAAPATRWCSSPRPTRRCATLRLGEIAQRGAAARACSTCVSGGDELGAWMTAHPVAAQDQLHRLGRHRQAGRGAARAGPQARHPRAGRQRPGDRPRRRRPGHDRRRSSSGGAFDNSGQICSAIKRVYVPEALHDDVVDALAEQAARPKVGDGTEPRASQLGPINNRPQFERVADLVADAVGRRRRRRSPAARPIDRPGYFFEPTILAGVARRHAHRRRGAVRPGRCRS